MISEMASFLKRISAQVTLPVGWHYSQLTKWCKLKKLSFIWIILLLNTGCSGIVLYIDDFQNNMTEFPNIISQIENNGIFIQNPTGLMNVYYLVKIDTLNVSVGVAYFLEWKNEFPDFGRTYETGSIKIISQIILPVFYTNWFYIPNSGGLQRILYGKHDIEGIFAIYSISNGSLNSLVFLTFESPGHNVIQFPNIEEQIEITIVSINNTPFVRVASWNHLFTSPINQDDIQHFTPKLFSKEKWDNYKMNKRRGEIAKIHLSMVAKND